MHHNLFCKTLNTSFWQETRKKLSTEIPNILVWNWFKAGLKKTNNFITKVPQKQWFQELFCFVRNKFWQKIFFKFLSKNINIFLKILDWICIVIYTARDISTIPNLLRSLVETRLKSWKIKSEFDLKIRVKIVFNKDEIRSYFLTIWPCLSSNGGQGAVYCQNFLN